MTKKTVVIIVALTLIIGLFTGCQDNLIERLEKVQAHITISVQLPDALKIKDDTDPNYFDPDTFSFTLTWYPTNDPSAKTEENFPYAENLAVVYKFDPGKYTFELEGVINKGTITEEVKAYGKRTIAIERGQRDKLEIPLTYYIYSKQGGFTVEGGVITLSGKLELEKNETISIPSDMKLVIEDGCTIDVGGTGSTLTFDGGGGIEALGDLTVIGNLALTGDGNLTVKGDLELETDDATTLTIADGLTLTVDGNVYTDGDLTLFGEGQLIVNGNLSVEKNLTANDDQLDVGGEMSYNYLFSEGNPNLLVVHVGAGETRDLASIGEGYTSIKVTGGGKLTYTGSAPLTLEAVGLEDGSTLQVGADGALEALDCGIITGDGTLIAATIEADAIETEAGEELTLTGDVTTSSIDGGGNLAVNGKLDFTEGADSEPATVSLDDEATLTVTGEIKAAGNLDIAGKGTLEADSLSVTGNLTTEGDVTVTNTLEVTGNATIDGEVSTGSLSMETSSKLTIVEDGSLAITNNGTVHEVVLAEGATMAVGGTLEGHTISGSGSLTATGGIDVNTIGTEDGKTLTLKGDVSVQAVTGTGKATVDGTITVESLTIGENATVVASGLETKVGKDTVTIGGGGSLQVGSDASPVNINIGKIELAGGSTLDVDGTLTASTSITGAGTLTADSVSTGLIKTTGDLTITAPTIDTDAIVLKDDKTKTLTLTGDAKTGSITGGGSLAVDGDLDLTATGPTTLNIASGATMTVTGDVDAAGTLTVSGSGSLGITGELDVEGNFTVNTAGVSVGSLTTEAEDGTLGTLTIGSAGSLSIKDKSTKTEIDNVVLAGGATFDVAGALDSGAISGDGTLQAGSIDTDIIKTVAGQTLTIDSSTVTTGLISNTGGMTITADTVTTDKIELVGTDTLTLNSNVTTGEISGSGKLDVQKIVGGDSGEIVITGNPTITGDLSLDYDTTLSFTSGTTLTVEGDVKAWGALTIEGEGTLDAENVFVDDKLSYDDTVISINVPLTGAITYDDFPLGTKPDLQAHISTDRTLYLDAVHDNGKTVTVTGGGNLSAKTVPPTLDAITLEDGSDFLVTGDPDPSKIGDASLTLSDGASLTLGTGSTLDVDGPVTAEGDLTLSGEGTLKALGLNVDDDATLTITGGGTINDTSITGLDLEKVVLEDDSKLTIGGELESDEISGSGTIKASTIVVDTIHTTASGDLNLDSGTTPIEVTKVTGDGTASIVGPANVNNLEIEDGATLEAKGIVIDVVEEKKTLTITGGGILVDQSKTDLSLTKVELAGGSALKIDKTNTLTSDTISGEGTVKAGSIKVTTIDTEVAANTITLEGAVTVTTVEGGGTVEVDGELKTANVEQPTSLTICVAAGTTLKVKSLDPAITSLTVTGGGTLKITDNSTLTTIALEDNSKIEFAGTLGGIANLSGSGTVVAKGDVTASTLNIGSGTTLDVSNSNAKLNISGEAIVAGVLDLGSGGWDSVDFKTTGTITLSGDADLRINNEEKWYTLYGAEAQYTRVAVVGSADIVQIRFLEGTGEKRVTPRITGITPTEPIVRVGTGALFEVTTINKLNLKAKQLILEDGSTTKIGENWWTAGTTFVFGNGGSVTANAGAIVTHILSNVGQTWIGDGDTSSGEWNLTGSTQLKYDGTITTVTGAGQLEINDWKGRDWTAANKLIRGLVHTMVIEENANVRFNIPYFNIFDKGKILIEDGGSVEVPGGSELKASVANGIVIKGTLTVYDGGTVNIKEKAFFFDGTATGQVFLKSGGIYSVSGVMYFAPPESKVSGSRSSLWFQTENVDLTFTFDTVSGTFLMKNYIIKPASEAGGTFTIVSSTVTLINHRITVDAGSTLTLGSSLSTLTLGSNTVKTAIMVLAGGRIKNNKTISISGNGTLYLEEAAISCGKKPSGTITGDGTWNTQACD